MVESAGPLVWNDLNAVPLLGQLLPIEIDVQPAKQRIRVGEVESEVSDGLRCGELQDPTLVHDDLVVVLEALQVEGLRQAPLDPGFLKAVPEAGRLPRTAAVDMPDCILGHRHLDALVAVDPAHGHTVSPST